MVLCMVFCLFISFTKPRQANVEFRDVDHVLTVCRLDDCQRHSNRVGRMDKVQGAQVQGAPSSG